MPELREQEGATVPVVIEVSVYDCCLGDLPGRNALVWEVRRY